MSRSYDGLVSSVPLPELIPMIEGAPQDVVDAARLLACSTCVLVNIGVNREDLSNAHMTYFYDEDICFTRLGFPHMLRPSNAPAGHGEHPGGSLLLRKIQALYRFSRRLDRARHQGSSPLRPLREDDQILSRGAMLLRYANIIFDLDRAAALKTVHGYLDDIGIAY